MISVSPKHRRQANGNQAFTLLELLVSIALLLVIAVLTTTITNGVSEAWKAQKSRLSSFEGARAGFEMLSNLVSQATLNTYWDYDNPAQPTRYQRKSELHFIVGDGATLLPDVSGVTGNAIFFVAPTGNTDSSQYRPLVRMLSACGFYVAFGKDRDRPSFFGARVGNRWRFRLNQLLEPGEQLGIYAAPSGNGWFQKSTADNSSAIVENAFGLILRTIYPTPSGSNASHYIYDSRASSSTPTASHHQLPPRLAVTLLVMDEDSAIRLADKYGEEMPPIGPPDLNAFTDGKQYESDLRKWEERLRELSIRYRIFTSEVPIRGAKWSTDL